jgi:hypothetical protein
MDSSVFGVLTYAEALARRRRQVVCMLAREPASTERSNAALQDLFSNNMNSMIR